MEKYVIEGGHPLSGSVTISGNKNEALPAIAACLLTDEPVTLRNVPRIGDVNSMLDIMHELGVEIEDLDKNDVRLCSRNLKGSELDSDKCRSLRAAILLAGPLITRHDHVSMPPPGGDVIGRRRLDTHFTAFESLGARVSEKDKKYIIEKKTLVGQDIFLEEQSVTATENVLMAAVLSKGETVLRNAACEPHVAGLARMLVAMGAKIEGIGTNILHIKGVDKLSGTDHTIGPDYLETGGYITLAAVTGSEMTIQNVNPHDLCVIKSTYRKLGVAYETRDNAVWVPSGQKLEIQPDFSGDVPKIDDGPWPAFPTDLMSIVIVGATQASGTVLIFEKMYDGRMFFVDYLVSMGARIVLCDPHRVVVVGPSQLIGSQMQSPDIRAGMALIIAALCAHGESSIYNIRQIDRGYENLEGKLQGLGAKIRRVVE
ncbi:UDP-N-acetylglucosamine 1-carboxyvinyltransferase [candidate division KSB1 bacterium RBG_16_48_16]|nr:MAG: UDP-N-acetylglucosamine 1-carboxyvinyltransferase [candidate division KSB1 bacterium RBG_16_48_16]